MYWEAKNLWCLWNLAFEFSWFYSQSCTFLECCEIAIKYIFSCPRERSRRRRVKFYSNGHVYVWRVGKISISGHEMIQRFFLWIGIRRPSFECPVVEYSDELIASASKKLLSVYPSKFPWNSYLRRRRTILNLYRTFHRLTFKCLVLTGPTNSERLMPEFSLKSVSPSENCF